VQFHRSNQSKDESHLPIRIARHALASSDVASAAPGTIPPHVQPVSQAREKLLRPVVAGLADDPGHVAQSR